MEGGDGEEGVGDANPPTPVLTLLTVLTMRHNQPIKSESDVCKTLHLQAGGHSHKVPSVTRYVRVQ